MAIKIMSNNPTGTVVNKFLQQLGKKSTDDGGTVEVGGRELVSEANPGDLYVVHIYGQHGNRLEDEALDLAGRGIPVITMEHAFYGFIDQQDWVNNRGIVDHIVVMDIGHNDGDLGYRTLQGTEDPAHLVRKASKIAALEAHRANQPSQGQAKYFGAQGLDGLTLSPGQG